MESNRLLSEGDMERTWDKLGRLTCYKRSVRGVVLRAQEKEEARSRAERKDL